MEQEAESLREANELIRREVEELKENVHLLRSLRGEEEEDEAKLLLLENELLRAQLKEQQAFLLNCQLLMNTLAPQEGLQYRVMKQGAEQAMYQLDALVSQCQLANDFQRLNMPSHCFKHAVNGVYVTCCLRKHENSIIMRVDGVFPKIDKETVAQGYWNTWVSSKHFMETFATFFPPQVVPFTMEELISETTLEGNETKINVYEEFHPHGTKKDFIYCMRKERRQVALSTLNLPSELNPQISTKRDQHSRKTKPQTQPVYRKRAKGSESASQLMGREECIVLARNTLRNGEELGIKDCVHMKLIEGVFVWEDHVLLDVEEGEEVKQERVKATRASAFVSFALNSPFVQQTDLYSSIVDPSVGNKATEKWALLVDSFYSRMGVV